MMNEDIAGIIERKLGLDLVNILANKLSGTELNSVLMKVFAQRTQNMSPADLLRSYEKNRFTQPGETDYIRLLRASAETLQFFRDRGFVPRQLSPLVPLGTCSIIAAVDQNKVVSATRNGEILADATNALALEIALGKKLDKPRASKNSPIKRCSVQRHMRAQAINIKGFSPHFTIGCLVTSGKDEGGYGFEFSAITDHLGTMAALLKTGFDVEELYIKLQPRGNYPAEFVPRLEHHLKRQLPDLDIRVDEHAKDNNYYQGIQFKIMIRKLERAPAGSTAGWLEIADGGMVDWTQKLLNDKKERYCISGFGLELLIKLEEGLL